MEDVVAATRRIEKILEEQTDSKMERLVSNMQDQIRLLKKDLKDANEQIAAHKAATPPATAMAAIPAPAAPTAAAAQPSPAAPARHSYQDYNEEPPLYRPPRRQMDRRPPRCFLCGEEGHLCPIVLPNRSSNAFFANKRAPAPAPRHEDKSWSYRLKRTTPIPTLTCS